MTLLAKAHAEKIKNRKETDCSLKYSWSLAERHGEKRITQFCPVIRRNRGIIITTTVTKFNSPLCFHHPRIALVDTTTAEKDSSVQSMEPQTNQVPSLINTGNEDLALIMKNVGLEAGPISPAATEGSCTTADETQSLQEPLSNASSPSNSGEDSAEDEWNLVNVPPSAGEEPSVVIVSSPPSRKAVLPKSPTYALSGLEGSFDVFDDVPTQLPTKEDLQAIRRREQEAALRESAGDQEDIDPLRLLKKGAVAALGGVMVGVGLVMIPLPTPFGAVVASSGMAVLGTEFEGAREMNEKILTETKTHWKKAREKIVQGIEEMNKEDDTPTEIETTDSSDQVDKQLKAEETTESPPHRLMSPMELKRQQELERTKNRPTFMNDWRKNTGAYLSKHLVPLLRSPVNGNVTSSEVESVPDAELTVQSDMETLSELDASEDTRPDDINLKSEGGEVQSSEAPAIVSL